MEGMGRGEEEEVGRRPVFSRLSLCALCALCGVSSEVPGGSLFTTEGTGDTEREGFWCCPGAWGRRAGLWEGRETTEAGGRGEEEDGVGGRSPPVFPSVLSAPSVVFLQRFRVGSRFTTEGFILKKFFRIQTPSG